MSEASWMQRHVEQQDWPAPIEEALEGIRAERDALEAENERLKEVWSELCVMRREYGDADDHSLTRDAIDLKRAICRVWDELELHAEGFATLADPTRRDDCECLLSRKLRGHVDQG